MLPDRAIGLRDATLADFAAVLALNHASVALLSPLTVTELAKLHAMAVYHRVAVADGAVVAFLLALAPGAAYDSANYQWFCARGVDFVYIDRIVVAQDVRAMGLGRRLYGDLAAWAHQRGIARLTCEYDLEPLNAGSQRFHAAFGFRQVGTQRVAGGTKLVSLQQLVLQ